ncbi:MAG: glycosyltransferase family 2 protein [Flavobacterium sp.]
MKTLTIFTPTYNRAYCLDILYNSLCNQTNQDFIWMVIDDGSSDNTKEIIQSWIAENKIEITYIYKENGGMHTGHNTAYDHIKTPINTCIDSDDSMPINAVENILNAYQDIKDNPKIAGIVGLDIFKTNEIVGTKFPDNIVFETLTNIYEKYKITGDKKLVLKTEIVNQYPRYPEFEGEKFVPLGILYLMIDQKYLLKCINQPLCIVEYLEDGSTRNIFKQYQRHPKGFRYSRAIELQCYKSFKTHVIKCLHFISSTLFIKDFNFFKNNPKKALTFVLLPIGYLFHLYLLTKLKK